MKIMDEIQINNISFLNICNLILDTQVAGLQVTKPHRLQNDDNYLSFSTYRKFRFTFPVVRGTVRILKLGS